MSVEPGENLPPLSTDPPLLREAERSRLEAQEWRTRAELTMAWAVIAGIILLALGIAIGLRLNDRAFDSGYDVGRKTCGK